MKQTYKRAMEHIRLSPQAREEIQSAMERPRPRRRLERPAVIAAVAAVVLTVTAAAAAMQLVFFHSLPQEVAAALQPVGRSVTSNGITLTVQSASIADGKFRAYVTMKDEEGGQLSEEGFDIPRFELSVLKGKAGPPVRVSLNGSDRYPFDRDIWPISETFPIDYDQESGTYGFLFEVRSKNGEDLPFPYQSFRLEACGFYAGRIEAEASLTPDWPDASQEAETAHVPYRRRKLCGIKETLPLMEYSYEKNSYTILDEGADLLAPQEEVLEVAENYVVSAIGWLDGKLHIQDCASGRKSRIDDGWFFTGTFGRMFPTRADGTRIEPELSYDFYSEDDLSVYTERVYDISPEELAGCTLAGEYRYGGEYISGDWCVDFSLEDAETQ